MRLKSLAAVALSVMLVSSVAFVVLRHIVLDRFQAAERARVERATVRVIHALDSAEQDLIRTANNFAAYLPALPDTSSADRVFQLPSPDEAAFFDNARLSLALVLDAATTPVYSRAYQPATGSLEPVDSDLVDRLRATTLSDDARQAAPASTLIPHEDVVHLLAAVPGDDGSVLVVGRALDEPWLAALGQMLSAQIAIEPLSAPTPDEDFQQAREQLSGPNALVVRLDDRATAFGYRLLTDTRGQPVALLRAGIERDIYSQGEAAASAIAAAIAGLAAAVILLIWLLFDRIFTTRLTRLRDRLSDITTNGPTAGARLERVSVAGQDEIAALSSSTNTILDVLERAHKRVIATQRQLTHVLQSTSHAIYMLEMDQDGSIRRHRMLSPHMAELAGLESEALQADWTLWAQAVHPDDRPNLHQHWEQLRHQPTSTVTYRIVRPDGSERWIEDRSHTIEINQQRRTIYCSISDITDQHKTEEEIAQREESFRLLFENNPHPMLVYDRETLQILEVNNAAVAHYGYSHDEFTSMTVMGLRPPEEAELFLEHVAATRSPYKHSGVWKHCRKDGSLMEMDIHSHLLTFEGHNAALIVAQDITEQQRTARALRESEEVYASMLTAIPDLIFRLDENGTYLDAHAGADNLLAAPANELIGKTVYDVLPATIADHIMEHLDRALTHPEVSVFEYMLDVPAGTRHFEARAVACAEDAVLLIVRDVTSQRESEQERESLLAQTRRLANELATVAAVSSQATTILDLDRLLWTVCQLTKENFYLYQAHIYLLSDDKSTLMLAAGAGSVGRQMVDNEHQIPIDHPRSFVARVARTREAAFDNDVEHSDDFLPNPLLPNTRAELAIPMVIGSQFLGVLDLQSDETNHFTDEDLVSKTILADQIAIAIQNARLFTENSRRLAIIENSTDIIMLLPIAGSRPYHPVYVNPSGLELLGHTSPAAITKTPLERFYRAEDAALLMNIALPEALQRGIWHGELDMLTKDGATLPTEVRLLVIYDERGKPRDLVMIGTNIAERKASEERLRDSEERLELALAGADFGSWNWEIPSGEFTTNDRWHEILGYDNGAIDTTIELWQRLIHPDDRKRVFELLEAHLEGKSATFEAEYRAQTKQGDWRWILNRGKIMRRQPDGSPLRMAGTILDITRRHRASQALRRANRAYRMLSECNQAIVHARDEAALLDTTCQVLAEHGGYALAWIGMIEDDQIVPVAHTPEHRQYVESLQLSTKPGPRGDGPAGQAVRSGLPQVTRDIAQSTKDSFWRHAALQRGFQSAITLPLTTPQAEIIGILTVYATQGNAFNAPEIELLSKIASDITFGIAGFRARVDRQRAQQAEREQRILAEALRDTVAAINSTLNLDEVLDHILANLERVIPHRQANIILIEAGRVHVARYRGYTDPDTIKWLDSMDLPVEDLGLLNRMIVTGQPVVTPDTALEPDWKVIEKAEWVRSYVGAPIIRDNDVIGFLNLDAEQPNTFAQEHGERLQAFTDQAAIAIHNAQLYATEQKQRALSEALRETAAAINSTLELEDLFDRIFSSMTQVIPHDAANIMRIEDGMAYVVRARGYDWDHAIEDFEISDLSYRIEETPLLEQMVTHQQAIAVPHTQDNPLWRTVTKTNWIRSFVSAPITREGDVIGFLNLDSATPGFFRQEDANKLRSFADQVSIAIHNSTLYTELQRRANELREQAQYLALLNRVATRLAQTLDLNQIYAICLSEIQQALGADYGGLVLFENDKIGRVAMGTHVNDDKGIDTIIPLEGNESIEYVCRTHKSLTAPDVLADSRFAPAWDVLRERGTRSLIIVPLLVGDQVIGTLGFDFVQRRDFSLREMEMVETIASQASVAITKSQLYDAERDQRILAEALRDTAALLNSTLNFDEVLERILENVKRVVPHDAANIMLIDGDTAYVVRSRGYAERGLDDWITSVQYEASEVPVWQHMLAHHAPFAIADVAQDPLWLNQPEEAWIRSTVKAPIIIEDDVAGILHLDSETPHSFDHNDARHLQAFADQAAIAIKNARLYDAIQTYATELEQRVEQRTAELDAQRAQLQTVLDSMGEGVIYTIGPKVMLVNQAFVDLMGYSADALHQDSRQLYQQIISRMDNYPEVFEEVRQALAENRKWQGDARLVRRNNSEFDAALTVTTVAHSGASKQPGVVTIIRDVSQEKALQAQKDRFIANASHELRTPLANVKTRLYLMQRQPEKLAGHLDVLERVTNGMTELIENLLDISRFERGVIPLYRRTIELRQAISNVVDIQCTEAEQRQIALHAILPDEPLHVHADQQRIEQVLTNLVTNAINYTDEGGQVTVSAERTSVDGDSADAKAIIRVTDNGPGIAPAHLEHIFEPFFRANQGSTNGTGLGLTIAHEIIELHNGDLTVESTLGEGSTFIITLDLVTE